PSIASSARFPFPASMFRSKYCMPHSICSQSVPAQVYVYVNVYVLVQYHHCPFTLPLNVSVCATVVGAVVGAVVCCLLLLSCAHCLYAAVSVLACTCACSNDRSDPGSCWALAFMCSFLLGAMRIASISIRVGAFKEMKILLLGLGLVCLLVGPLLYMWYNSPNTECPYIRPEYSIDCAHKDVSKDVSPHEDAHEDVSEDAHEEDCSHEYVPEDAPKDVSEDVSPFPLSLCPLRPPFPSLPLPSPLAYSFSSSKDRGPVPSPLHEYSPTPRPNTPPSPLLFDMFASKMDAPASIPSSGALHQHITCTHSPPVCPSPSASPLPVDSRTTRIGYSGQNPWLRIFLEWWWSPR
ncbi:hypothetical protein NECID01_2172, partial [Nematocida sp. AWRm77]